VVLTFVDEFLTRQGYTLLKATEAQKALELSREHAGEIDLLLSDVVMPGLNGVDLCQALMKDDPELKVLLMSGYTGRRIAADAAAANLDRSNFLQKPFTAELLGRKIREVLDGREQPALYSSDKV
jgi:DNA-binding NtrC family response regulator